MLHEPFAHELLAQLLLGLAPLLAFGVALQVEVARAVRGVHLVDEQDAAFMPAELVLGVHQDQAPFPGQLPAAGEQCQGVAGERVPFLRRAQPARQDLVGRDVLVVAFVSLGAGGDDGLRQLIVLAQALRQGCAAEGAVAGLVGAPGMAGQVAAHHHLDLDGFAGAAHDHLGIGHGLGPVGHHVLGGLQHVPAELGEHLALEGNAARQDDVEGTDAVGGHQHQAAVGQGVDVAHLAVVNVGGAGQLERGAGEGAGEAHFRDLLRGSGASACLSKTSSTRVTSSWRMMSR